MSTDKVVDRSLLSRPMLAVIVAQFLSAFGDNALLFVTLAVLKTQKWPEWSSPVMQMLFVAAYIILAPFVGQLADSFAKGRVMMLANLLKLAGALLIFLGVNPFVGYSLVGAGAAAYSPAKYGILGEITHGERLVKANGMMESSTIAAILLGAVIGGILSDWDLQLALLLCAGAYGLAMLSNCLIPRLPPAQRSQSWHPLYMLSRFVGIGSELWRDSEARLSLAGTSLFWGAGVTLRFLLILWVPQILGISDNKTPSLLNAMVAIGIVIGAMVADKLVTLKTIQRCMPAGVLTGVMVILFALQQNLILSYVLLVITGVMGGFFIVPLNAMLQARGKQSVGAGNAVAVQNFGENSAMLIMLGLYSLAVWGKVPLLVLGLGFGGLLLLAMSVLWRWYRISRKHRDVAANS